MFRHRLFEIEFKPANTMNQQTGTQAPAQAGIEDFNGIFQEQLRGIVRDELLAMFEQEVTALCGESYRPSASVHRRAYSSTACFPSTNFNSLPFQIKVPVIPLGNSTDPLQRSPSNFRSSTINPSGCGVLLAMIGNLPGCGSILTDLNPGEAGRTPATLACR